MVVQNWTNVGLKTSRYINRIVIDPRNTDIVFVAAFALAASLVAVAPAQAVFGDLQGLWALHYQPQKVAAMEGHWETQRGAPLILFGIPAVKDARGSGADDPEGIVQLALGDVRAEVGDDLVVMADLCLDEFTDHGHCGVLTADGRVDNDRTLEVYAAMAVAQAAAGVDLVGPSGMMDGQVGVIRAALDSEGYTDVAILAYSAKYASAFYGPFREAVDSSLQGDRRTYQQDPANAREGVREALLDVEHEVGRVATSR